MSIEEKIGGKPKVRVYRGRIYINRDYLQEQKDKLYEATGSKGVTLKRPSEQDIRWGMRESILYRK